MGCSVISVTGFVETSNTGKFRYFVYKIKYLIAFEQILMIKVSSRQSIISGNLSNLSIQPSVNPATKL